MKRLAAVAVMVALMVGWPSCGAFAQHGGGSHGGGFSGGGFSGSHAGFSGAGGFSGRSAPAFHGGFSAAPRSGFSRPAPPMSPRMYGAPARYAPSPSSYRAFPGNAVRPTGGPRMPSTTGTYRAPYHSPYTGDHNHGYGYHYPHNHVVIVSSVWPYWGWGYPYGYGWGYPYFGLGYSGFFNDSDNYDSQQPSYYAAPQDYYNVPYQQPQPEDQQQPPENYPQQPQQPIPQQPSGARAPYSGAQAPPPGSQALTVIFKDGRPPEQVYNYLLTANTLTVLDQNRHDIPVDEINLEATAQVNIQAGVEFSLPVRTP